MYNTSVNIVIDAENFLFSSSNKLNTMVHTLNYFCLYQHWHIPDAFKYAWHFYQKPTHIKLKRSWLGKTCIHLIQLRVKTKQKTENSMQNCFVLVFFKW